MRRIAAILGHKTLQMSMRYSHLNVESLREDPEVGPMLDLLPIPLGRKGTAQEMAGVVAFMLSEDAAYINGMMMWVDGGTDAAIRPDRF